MQTRRKKTSVLRAEQGGRLLCLTALLFPLFLTQRPVVRQRPWRGATPCALKDQESHSSFRGTRTRLLGFYQKQRLKGDRHMAQAAGETMPLGFSAPPLPATTTGKRWGHGVTWKEGVDEFEKKGSIKSHTFNSFFVVLGSEYRRSGEKAQVSPAPSVSLLTHRAFSADAHS